MDNPNAVPNHPHRAIGTYAGGTKIKITWPCGHHRTTNWSKHSDHCKRGVGPKGVTFIAHYWRRESEGVNAGPCPTCGRDESTARIPRRQL